MGSVYNLYASNELITKHSDVSHMRILLSSERVFPLFYLSLFTEKNFLKIQDEDGIPFYFFGSKTNEAITLSKERINALSHLFEKESFSACVAHWNKIFADCNESYIYIDIGDCIHDIVFNNEEQITTEFKNLLDFSKMDIASYANSFYYGDVVHLEYLLLGTDEDAPWSWTNDATLTPVKLETTKEIDPELQSLCDECQRLTGDNTFITLLNPSDDLLSFKGPISNSDYLFLLECKTLFHILKTLDTHVKKLHYIYATKCISMMKDFSFENNLDSLLIHLDKSKYIKIDPPLKFKEQGLMNKILSPFVS